MRVKIDGSLSTTWKINGGSPQGSVSANALFCATTEFLQQEDYEGSSSSEINQARIYEQGRTLNVEKTLLHCIELDQSQTLDDEHGYVIPFHMNGRDVSDSDDPSFNAPQFTSSPNNNMCAELEQTEELSVIEQEIVGQNTLNLKVGAGRNNARRIEDTNSEESYMEVENLSSDYPDRWKEQDLGLSKYIDDGLDIEALCNMLATQHITHLKEMRMIRAAKS